MPERVARGGGRVDLVGPSGRLEGLIDEPLEAPRAGVVFAHPHPLHGGSMHTKVVYRVAKTLAAIGCAVLRFNFSGVGQSEGSFGGGEGEMEDFAAALRFMAARTPARELWAGGFSFGAWVALSVGSRDDNVSTLLGVGVPAGQYRYDALIGSHKPTFLIHGERDEICLLTDVRRLYARLEEPKELVVIDGADHLFDGRTLEVGDAVRDLLGDVPGDRLRDSGGARA